jgi:hypothetical protein
MIIGAGRTPFEAGQRIADLVEEYTVLALASDPWKTHSQKAAHRMQVRRETDGETRWVSLDVAEGMMRAGTLRVLEESSPGPEKT